VQRTVQQLLDQLQASEHDKFAAHLYQSRREYRHVCERTGKSGKQIERCVISTFRVAESMGLRANFVNGSICCELLIDCLQFVKANGSCG
jgi:hypothetical protein